jgi:mannose-6-phosphate isomerase
MTIEQTCTHIVPKPWGSTDLRPWNSYHGDGAAAVGEIWFQRTDAGAPESALLLKLLFTNQPLSIQVHPDDAFARSIGLAHGKSEAWYVLAAAPDAKIALGLTRRLSQEQLRESINERSISELVHWRPVTAGEVVFVSAGMIHAIGPGLVILEIQQRSDATFRLFDYGRQRELHVDNAVAAANGEQTAHQAPRHKLSTARTLLVASLHFVLERLELPSGSDWELLAAGETWLFILDGRARIGSIDACANEAIFLEADRTRIQVGSDGLEGVVAYVGCGPVPNLLRSLDGGCPRPPVLGRERSRLQPSMMPVAPVSPISRARA